MNTRFRSACMCVLPQALFLCLCTAGTLAWSQTTTSAAPPNAAADIAPGQVVVSGTVPDEAARAAIIRRLTEVYGAARIVDRTSVGNVVSPPNWSADVQKLITPNLKSVSKGQLAIEGTTVSLRGEVANEAQRQSVASTMATALNQNYLIKNNLSIASGEPVDPSIGSRIEFEVGSAMLTDKGNKVLDEVLPTLARISSKKIEIIGHTDSAGARNLNLALSRARAEAVKTYLVSKGIAPERLSSMGLGPDQPLASNDTEDGRRRNRRIEFRVTN